MQVILQEITKLITNYRNIQTQSINYKLNDNSNKIITHCDVHLENTRVVRVRKNRDLKLALHLIQCTQRSERRKRTARNAQRKNGQFLYFILRL